MPGTWGTIGAVLIAPLFIELSTLNFIIMCGLLFVVGCYVSEVCLKHANYHDPDPSWIVIDEVVGYLCGMFCVALFCPLNLFVLLLLFIFFRIFDITKPWPISWIDQALAQSPKTAALGIMLDDVLAGVFAALFTLFALRVF